MSQAAFEKAVQIKTTSSTAWIDLGANAATLNFAGELLDDTTFGSTGFRSRVRGLKDYSLDATVFWSTGSDVNTLRSALLNGTALDFRYLPNGTNGFQGRGVVENMNHSGDVGALETIEVSLQPTDQTALTTV